MSNILSLFKSVKGLLLLSIILGGGIGAFVGYQWIASNTVKSNVSNTNLEITGMQLLAVNQSTMRIHVNFTIENPSSHVAKVEGNNLNISILNDSNQIIRLGTLNIGELTVEPGMNYFSEEYTILLTGEEAFSELVNIFIYEENIHVEISGNLRVSVNDLLIPVKTTVYFERTVSIPALNELRDLTVNSLELIDTSGNSLTFQLNASVYNPSYLQIDIALMNWSILYDSVLIGNVIASNIKLVHGLNEFVATGSLQPNETSVVQELVSRYISGENVSVILDGEITIGLEGTPEYYISNVQLPVVLSGQPDIQLYINEVVP